MKNTTKKKKFDKDDLVRAIAAKGDFTLGDSSHIVDTLVEILEECVENRVNFSVRELFSIVYAELPEREANRVVRGSKETGERIMLPAVTRMTFRPSKNIKSFL